MSEETKRRISALASDHNVDLEDLRHVLEAALADGTISAEEQEALLTHLDEFEPAAKYYLEDILADTARPAPNRLLLAPHPKGTQPDIYYARSDVVALQDALGHLGFSTAIDGDYGGKTAKAVGDFQASVGLPRTETVDSNTLLAMNQQLITHKKPLLDFSVRAKIRPDTVVALRGAAPVENTKILQEGLRKLGEKFGVPGMEIEADGVFGEKTEVALIRFQRMAYLPETGILDVATLNALNAALELAGFSSLNLALPTGGGGFHGKVELHFYPGSDELKVYVLQDGKVLDTYGMIGGRNAVFPDPNNPHVRYDPTPKGKYTVDLIGPHTSSVWGYSYVPYGAPLREVEGEIQFCDGKGRWHFATGPKGIFRKRNPQPPPREAYLEGDGSVAAIWTSNDFGHLRARLKSLATGAIQTHMIHAVPVQEVTTKYFQETAPLTNPGAAASELGYSHGCEHIHPKDLDDMISRGYLAPGTQFVVHGYDEVFRPA